MNWDLPAILIILGLAAASFVYAVTGDSRLAAGVVCADLTAIGFGLLAAWVQKGRRRR